MIVKDKTITVDNKWDDSIPIYVYDNAIEEIRYPFTFSEDPVVNVTPIRVDYSYWLFTGMQGSYYTHYTPRLSVIRINRCENLGLKVCIHAIGKIT